RPSPSPTFEGRDVFAPAAAWIARGTELHHFGAPADDLVRLETLHPAFRPGTVARVRVLVVDRFGNATLDLARRDVEPILSAGAPAPRIVVETPGGPVMDLLRTYGDGAPGRPFLLFNSAGHLEVAVREARASEKLGLTPGKEVAVAIR
ncbi:MAG: SAM-dependent chlorinase/fluorinase, partial [Acidobacteriia bacterium]|nr:SAM-dependent chlorinase/fluorinase [Terriglobia bacterium]